MINNCRECNAGLYQASQMNIGWRCPVHGVEQVQVAQILLVVSELRDENARLRVALNDLYDDWNGPLTEATEQARQALYGNSPA